tara:strand:+ start:268 stop:681 length:414 start_codon:yes stop_codon:yes gene_type:complete
LGRLVEVRQLVVDPSIAFQANNFEQQTITGKEPCLGGKLREKAVWVDESACIGCRYCGNVATNTFIMEDTYGRARAARQDGDDEETIQEAIDTCPVDCIHWVAYEELDDLRRQLEQLEFQSLGMLPKISKRIKPRAN